MTTATTKEHEEVEVLTTEPDDLREEALRRLRKRRDFSGHLIVYLLVNAVVWGIWAVVGANSHSWWPWPIFVTLFWGIGLVMNAWDVYMRKPITEDELEREIKQLRG